MSQGLSNECTKSRRIKENNVGVRMMSDAGHCIHKNPDASKRVSKRRNCRGVVVERPDGCANQTPRHVIVISMLSTQILQRVGSLPLLHEQSNRNMLLIIGKTSLSSKTQCGLFILADQAPAISMRLEWMAAKVLIHRS